MEPLSLTARLASTSSCICSGSGSVFDTVAGHMYVCRIGMCVACVYLTGDSSSCRFCLTTNMTRAERNLTRGKPHSALPHLPFSICHPRLHPHPHRDRRHAHRQRCRLLLLCTLQIEFSTRIRSELLAAEKHVKNKAPAECVCCQASWHFCFSLSDFWHLL